MSSALLLSACSGTPDVEPRGLNAAARGLAFAQTNCGSCHAVATGVSSNAAAPTFADVINDPELTAETLTPWLRNSHNFPDIMAFEISPEHIEDLAAHMLTLKDPHYKPRVL